MSATRGVAVAVAAVLAVSLLTGVTAFGAVGVATASHGPDAANFTVVPMSDRTPGAENVRYGQRVVAQAGTDLETLERTRAVFEEGSFSKCGPSSGETFGIDRGATKSGYGIDEDLTDNVKSFTAGADVFKVEYYGEDGFGASTHLNDGDEFISVAKCIDNPDDPGWYRITGSTTGVTERGERVTFSSESHYFWICNCRDEAEARQQLGPPPSEPQRTPTATVTATPSGDGGGDTAGGSGSSGQADDGSEGGAGDAEQTSPERATATPTATTTVAGGTATATARPAPDGSGGGDGTGSADGATTPTAAWDYHGRGTPTAAEGPGFGLAPALVGILAAVFLVGRRR